MSVKLLAAPKAPGRWTTKWIAEGRREVFLSPEGEWYARALEGAAADRVVTFARRGLQPLRLKRFNMAKWERKQAKKARQRAGSRA